MKNVETMRSKEARNQGKASKNEKKKETGIEKQKEMHEKKKLKQQGSRRSRTDLLVQSFGQGSMQHPFCLDNSQTQNPETSTANHERSPIPLPFPFSISFTSPWLETHWRNPGPRISLAPFLMMMQYRCQAHSASPRHLAAHADAALTELFHRDQVTP